MKKKSMMLGGLLAAVAVTAYSVSGTYAKYISSVDLTDEARVAKWGFNTTNEIDLFGSSYVNTGTKYVQAFKNSDDTIDNVVAPGTKGEATIALTGEMETRFNLSFNLVNAEDFVVYYLEKEVDGEKVLLKSTKADDTIFEGAKPLEYHPIRYSIAYNKVEGEGASKKTTAVVTKDGQKVEDLLKNLDIKKLNERLEAYNANNYLDAEKTQVNLEHTFAPGKLNREIIVSWKWDTINTGLAADLVNKLDTFAGQELSSKKIKFGVNVTAEQVAVDHSVIESQSTTVQP